MLLIIKKIVILDTTGPYVFKHHKQQSLYLGYTRGGPCQHGFMCGCRQWSNDINESN